MVDVGSVYFYGCMMHLYAVQGLNLIVSYFLHPPVMQCLQFCHLHNHKIQSNWQILWRVCGKQLCDAREDLQKHGTVLHYILKHFGSYIL